ncbi:MAG: glycerophosphodiester phosphodiesterase, partial [Vicinamibacterales bacterium]
MAHPFLQVGRRLVFAHRGGSDLAPENTLAAFDNGLAQGADGLELDVRLSADGVPVVLHDLRLDRTSNLTGPVSAFTARELAGADAGFHFQTNGRQPFRGQGVGIPTLESVLTRYPGVPLIIELKEESEPLVESVIAGVRAAGASDRVCLGSFSWRALRRVRSLAPDLATSAARAEVRWALYRSRCRFPVHRVPYRAYQVPEVSRGSRVVSARFVADAHGAGLPVQVWTVDRTSDAQRLIEWGVDGLITDRPDVVVPLVRGSLSASSSP